MPIVDLGSVKGPVGATGPQGVQGLAGVNGVANDTATASYVPGPSATATALAKAYAPVAAPAGVTALSAVGQVPPNAATILQPFYAALSGRRFKRANVVVIGDSIVDGTGVTNRGDRWVSRLAANLQARYPSGVVGGRGFMGVEAHADPDWVITWGGDASIGGTDRGPKRDFLSLGTTGTITYSLTGTSADIMYMQAAGRGKFSYQVDAAAAVTVDTNVSPEKDGVILNVPLGTAGPHTLKISLVTGPTYIDGVVEHNGDENAGIAVHDAGHGGYKSADFIAGGHDAVMSWPASIVSLQPDLLVLAIGVNDIAQSVPIATYQSNMTTLIGYIRAALPVTPIVFVPYGVAQTTTNHAEMVTAMYQLATADGNAIVADLSLRLPSYAQGDGAWFDGNHPNGRGAQMIADFMTSFLSPS